MKHISTKMLFSIAVLILLLGTSTGFSAYYFAKKQLVESGKLNIKHVVENAVSLMTYLDKQVEEGDLTLEEAKEIAREMISGPKLSGAQGLVHDYSQSSFVYKNDGYIYASYSDGRGAMSPFLTSKEDSEAILAVRKMNIQAAQHPDEHQRYTEYSWRDFGQEPRDKITYNTYFAPWDWNVGLGAYADEFYEGLSILKWIIGSITGGMMAISLAFFYLLSRGKFALLHQITKNSEQIANGDLTLTRLPESDDEFGKMSQSFNRMNQNLRNLISDMRTITINLVQSANTLHTNSFETSKTSNEITLVMNEIAAGSANQSLEVEGLLETNGVLVKAMKQMSVQNERMIEATTHSKERTAKGLIVVQKLKERNQHSISASNEIDKHISSLYKRVRDIASVTKSVQAVSDQTNLLALNASIEAARAGASGRGFSVVADEIRKLAAQSNQATRDIQKMIEEIEDEAEVTVKAMDDSNLAFQHLNEVVGDVETDFRHISEAVDDTMQSIEQLSSEIYTVTKQSDGIRLAIQEILTVSAESAVAVDRIIAAVDEHRHSIESNAELARGLSETSEIIRSIIQRYQY
ncbi:hypothetical protein BEP19_09000 [Ammoniphilus oxalaticus]|uniref:Chemotaxis protein n=1 Tax=Ammoniphilus oxalaticus TaxID=66863 RepID=A0A419SKL0_9BACL|nr:methyl-accepting chemotaxis protein [Ammoniphilus oxalaticus]RKD24512.1 hypothetical protein BEP19_09000 [Ammoniphilus oxalaticus]